MLGRIPIFQVTTLKKIFGNNYKDEMVERIYKKGLLMRQRKVRLKFAQYNS